MSPFPWTITMCSGSALQFLITDANNEMVAMTEMYSKDDLLSVLTLFQRNPEIRVDVNAFKDNIRKVEFQQAENYLDGFREGLRLRFLKENNYDVIKAAEAIRAWNESPLTPE